MAKQVFNCDFCGRDTTSRSRICQQCCPSRPGHERPEEAEKRRGKMQTNTFLSDGFDGGRDDDVLSDVDAAILDAIGTE